MKLWGKAGSRKGASGVITGGVGGRFTKKQLIIAAVILVLLAAGYGFYSLRTKMQISKNQNICGDEIITEASELLYPNDKQTFDKLPGVISRIRSLENYQKDINCMYPIAVFTIFNSYDQKTPKELEYYSQLENKQPSDKFGYKMSSDEIKQSLELLIEREKTTNDNAILFN